MARKRDSDEDCLKILRQVELDLADGAEKALSEADVRSGRLLQADRTPHQSSTMRPLPIPHLPATGNL